MDQFVAAYKDALSKYAQFSGRTSVGGYWRFVAVNIVAAIVLYILALIAKPLIFLFLIYWLALAIPSLAAVVRRLHDTGKSGWYYFIGIIPIVGPILLLVQTVKAGDPSSNQYGPPAA
ncbi:MAG: DUF805 domain-containing protein [Ilumatobacteraceae bacterium]